MDVAGDRPQSPGGLRRADVQHAMNDCCCCQWEQTDKNEGQCCFATHAFHVVGTLATVASLSHIERQMGMA